MSKHEYSDVINWLADREGVTVYMEFGGPNPELNPETDQRYPLAIHTKLGKIDIGVNADHDNRGIVYLRLPELGDRSRIYIDKEWVSRVEIDGTVLRVWFTDDSYYLAFSAYSK